MLILTLLLLLILLTNLVIAINNPIIKSIHPAIIDYSHISKDKYNQDWDIGQFGAIAGALSCSITHSLLTPLDVVKTKLQNDATRASLTIFQSLSNIIKSEGLHAIFTGLTATATGYFLQGAFKFGLYDHFKIKVNKYCVNSNINHDKFKVPILIGCSSLAELVASFYLCPLEAVKIYMMVNPNIAMKGMLYNLGHIIKEGGGIYALYKGLPWIILRQIPYTCVKLAGYDIVSSFLREKIYNNDENTTTTNVNIQLTSGIIAGLFAAIISQPADVILSKVCSYSASALECTIINKPSDLLLLIQSLGVKGCYTGFNERACMVVSMTAIQFLLYENIKSRLYRIYNKYYHLL